MQNPTPDTPAGSQPQQQCAVDAAFGAHWRGVPVRALLPWLSQMLSRLGEEGGAALAAPLEALARRWGSMVVGSFSLGWGWVGVGVGVGLGLG